jgi:acetyl-CoA C-acetyltransferase
MVAEPYTKLMCSFPTVDLAAAVVVTGAASGGSRPVRPLSIAAAKEPGPPSVRRSIGASVALDRSVERALDLAGVDPDAIARFDLYSCFPAAVQLAVRAFGIGDEDPRPRTVTGGLPYFGGPGASYTIHAVVSMVEELRADPGSIGAVVGVGGMVDDFSVGLYSTADAPYRAADLGVVAAGSGLRPDGAGVAVVDAMTVLHDRDLGPTEAPVLARFEDGSRIGARIADPDLAAALSGTNLVGREVTIETVDGRSRYTPV